MPDNKALIFDYNCFHYYMDIVYSSSCFVWSIDMFVLPSFTAAYRWSRHVRMHELSLIKIRRSKINIKIFLYAKKNFYKGLQIGHCYIFTLEFPSYFFQFNMHTFNNVVFRVIIWLADDRGDFFDFWNRGKYFCS